MRTVTQFKMAHYLSKGLLPRPLHVEKDVLFILSGLNVEKPTIMLVQVHRNSQHEIKIIANGTRSRVDIQPIHFPLLHLTIRPYVRPSISLSSQMDIRNCWTAIAYLRFISPWKVFPGVVLKKEHFHLFLPDKLISTNKIYSGRRIKYKKSMHWSSVFFTATSPIENYQRLWHTHIQTKLLPHETYGEGRPWNPKYSLNILKRFERNSINPSARNTWWVLSLNLIHSQGWSIWNFSCTPHQKYNITQYEELGLS